jgi:SprT protein
MKAEKTHSVLLEKLPPATTDYCFSLWKQTPFELKLTRSRQTKVGDFTSRGSRAHPRITLNHDLNPYLFLATYIHEVAHLHVYLKHGNRVDPHGNEWKRTFQILMAPLLQENAFPVEILHELRRHMTNPKASSFADTDLTKAFRLYDHNYQQQVALSEIPEGSIFKLQGRYFSKGKLRRTRVICKEIKSKKNYLVPVDALVSDVQLSLL